MKRKSIFTFCAIALMLVLSLSVLTACNKNNHEFSSDWKFDETNHWHENSCLFLLQAVSTESDKTNINAIAKIVNSDFLFMVFVSFFLN